MNISITGSLGHIGKPLTEKLVRQGHSVVVISSSPDRQKDIEALGATAAIGTLDDADFITATFANADAVFAMVPPSFKETDQVAYYRRIARNYAQAIAKTGLKRVVHLSSYGAHLTKDTGFILGAHYAEGILNALPNVSLTHLRAGYFYYNLYGFTDMIRTQGIIGSNYGGNDLIALVHPTDIAAAAAQELQSPAVVGQSVRYVVSDERTASEVAHVLGEAIDKPDLAWLTFTDAQTKEALVTSGVPDYVATNFVELGASLHNGKLLEDYREQVVSPTGTVKIDDFAKEFADVYAQADPSH